jgi:hypothetical protein
MDDTKNQDGPNSEVADSTSVEASPDQNDLWRGRIDRRERALKDKASRNNWERYIREYQGDFSEILSGTQKVIPLNLIYAYVRTEIPSLYQQDPYFEFTPKQSTTIGSAKLKEIAVNDIWHRKKFKREVKKGIQDAKLIGHAWYKVGYNSKAGNLEEFENNTENSNNDDYFFYRLNWRHVLFNDEAVDPPFDATWIAQKFFVPLKTAKENSDWSEGRKNLVGVKLSGNDKTDDKRSLVSNAVQGDVEFAELYEIWDKVNQKVIIFSTHASVGILHTRPWPYQLMQNFPFMFLSLSFVNDDAYGISDVGMGETHVMEKTKIRTAFLEHIKRGNRQLLTKKDNFDQEAKDAYQKGDDSILLECENPDAVKAMPYAAFQPDVFTLESRLDDDLAQIWGQRPNDRAGQARTQTRTKFELQQQTNGSTTRLAEEQNLIEDLVEEAAEKLSSLLEQYATGPFWVRITGYKPEKIAKMLADRPSATGAGAVTNTAGFTITNADIKGPVDVRIKEGSAVPLDKQGKIALLKELIQLAPEAGAVPGGPFIGTCAKMLVEEAGLHELTDALDAEIETQQARQKQATEQQTQATEMQVGVKSTEMQLKAEELANEKLKIDNTKQVEMMKIIKDLQIAVAQLQSDAQNRDSAE